MSLQSEVQVISIDDLKPYPHNPRKGNIRAIAESLEVSGQYKPIIVQQSTMYVLAGNHTRYGAGYIRDMKPPERAAFRKALGLKGKGPKWNTLECWVIDVDDEAAARIVLADNRTADLGTYDTEALAEVMKLLPDSGGTGYTEEDRETFLKIIESDQVDLNELAEIVRPSALPDMGSSLVIDDDDFNPDERSALVSHGSGKQSAVVEGDDDSNFEKMSEELPGVLQLNEDLFFEGAGEWQIPLLHPERYMRPEEIPEKLEVWAGSATRDDEEPDRWWLYNYGIDSTSGMKDLSKIIMSFYAFDEYFESWWFYPAKHVTRMLNAGVKYAITPDFSQWNYWPRATWLWSVYRSRWIGRFMQEAGIRIIPDLEFGDPRFLREVVVPTLVGPVPVVSKQTHNVDFKEAKPEELEAYEGAMRHAVTTLQTELFINYGTPAHAEWVDSWNLPCDVLNLTNRVTKLAAHQKAKKQENKGRPTL